MDGILVYSKTREENYTHMELILHKLKNMLFVSPETCFIMRGEVDFSRDTGKYNRIESES